MCFCLENLRKHSPKKNKHSILSSWFLKNQNKTLPVVFSTFFTKTDLQYTRLRGLHRKKQQSSEQSKVYQILQETAQEARKMQKLSHQSDPENDPLLQLKEKLMHTIFGFGKLESEQNVFPTITTLVFPQTIVLFNFDCLANWFK